MPDNATQDNATQGNATQGKPLVRRLDHIMFCVRDRHAWAADVERVLALRRGRGRDSDDWGFSNWEFDIGDGFMGVVSPDDNGTLLQKFLAARGDSHYSISVDVGSLDAAAERFARNGVHYRPALRDGVPALLWPRPAGTGGVLFQVTDGVPSKPGSNRNIVGLGQVTIATTDREASAAGLDLAFGLTVTGERSDTRLGADVAVLAVPGSPLGNEMLLAQPAGSGELKEHVDRYGTSVYAWTLETADLDRELARLKALGITCASDPDNERIAWLPPEVLTTMHIGFRQSVS